MVIRLKVQVRQKPCATEFFNVVVQPLWQRFTEENSAIDLCCAVTVMLDQMVDWIAVESDETPKQVRERLAKVAPEFGTLNLIARTLKHRELDRGNDKGLRDIFCVGMPAGDGLDNALAPVFWPDLAPGRHPPGPRLNTGVRSDELLKRCFEVIAAELGISVKKGADAD